MTPALLTPPPPRVQPAEDATRREFIHGIGAAALAAAFLAACGDDEDKAATPEATTRVISSKYGTYEIPVDPKRLLLMGNRYDLETALALGLTPIAIGREYAFSGGTSDYVAPWVPFEAPDGIEVFDAGEGSIEQLLVLRPDLIFCQGYHLDNTDLYRSFATLSNVAPVVPTSLLPWREDLQQIARWLGREEHLARTFDEYDAQRDSVRQKHAQPLMNAKVAAGYPTSDNEFWLVSTGAPDAPTSGTLIDLGGSTIHLPEEPGSPGWTKLSFENLRMLDEADALLIYATDDASREILMRNPLWQLLNIVKTNRVVISPNNLGTGSVYTRMECLRLWDQVYSTLA
jgi:iron complex transport system substrate-binding protein